MRLSLLTIAIAATALALPAEALNHRIQEYQHGRAVSSQTNISINRASVPVRGVQMIRPSGRSVRPGIVPTTNQWSAMIAPEINGWGANSQTTGWSANATVHGIGFMPGPSDGTGGILEGAVIAPVNASVVEPLRRPTR